MRLLGSMLLLVAALHTASAAEPCTAPPEALALVEDQHAKVDAAVEPKVYAPPLVATWKKYLAAHPTDAFALQELYSLQVEALEDEPAFRAELADARKAGLDEVMALDLEARLAAPDDAAAEAKYRAALALSPKSHIANLGLAQLLLKQKKLTEARAPILAALAACPEDPYAYRALAKLKDKALLAAHLKTLRAHLDASKDTTFLPAYATLWELSFRVAAPPAHAALRKLVAADVARLRALGDSLTLRLYQTLASGYKILGDEDGEKWVKAERARRFPDASDTVNDALDALREEEATHVAHTAAQRHAQAAHDLEITHAWVKKWPRWSAVWEEHLDALRSAPRSPVAEVEAATAALVRLGSTRYSSIADAYEHYGIHTEQIAKLVDKDVAHAEASVRDFSRHAQADQEEFKRMLEENVQRTKLGGMALVIHAQIKLGQKDAARATLKNMEAVFASLPPATTPDALEERSYVESGLFGERGRVAMAEGHTADALAYFLHALSLVPPDKDPPEPGEMDLRIDAEQEWTKLGGTKAAYALLPTGAARPSATDDLWRPSNEPAPNFSLRDLKGKQWRLRELAGKTVVMTMWATWCEPCKMEMPDVKALAKKLAGNKDVVLLSLNLDSDGSLVAPFVKENGIEYPVLLPGEGPNPFFKDGHFHIPLTMVIDKHGQIRGRTTGFHPGLADGEWLASTLKVIDAAH